MTKAKITAFDVARRAGVSQPTVSRVFSPGARVTPELRERVQKAATDLGYRPNTLARSLNTGRSRTIGVVVAYLKNPFFVEALEQLSRSLQARGYHVLFLMAANQEEEVDPLVEDLLAHQVDGIILVSVSMSNMLTDRLRNINIPFVLFNRGQEKASIVSVTSDNFNGGLKAARFLAAARHERIAHIAGWQDASTGRDRQAGFVRGLSEQGIKPLACIDGFFRRQAAIDITRELFSVRDTPDAIFTGNDYMAFGVIDFLRKQGKSIPQDVSVIGFGDVAMAAWEGYELTTLRQPMNRMVKETTDRLLGMIEIEDYQADKI
jgi:DNA-binding LacI/PurR family transcriptional regulator